LIDPLDHSDIDGLCFGTETKRASDAAHQRTSLSSSICPDAPRS
jgi:hypothetical protein